MRKEALNLQVPLVEADSLAGLVSSFFGRPLSRFSSWWKIHLSEFRSGSRLVVVGSGYSMKANLASDSVSRLIEGLLISRTWFIRAVAR